MIIKAFYDEDDYKVVLKLLNGMNVSIKDMERVFARQMFLESINPK